VKPSFPIKGEKQTVISQKEVNVKENAKVFLKITVPDNEVRREYDGLVKEYCDKAVIKGFRKGKVPADVLLRKFGAEIKDETAFNIIKKSLEEAFQSIKEKPLAYAHPEVTEKKDLELGKDFSFEVSYDTYPTVELGNYKGIKVERPVVELTEEDVARELAALQEKNSIVKEKKEGVTEKGNIVTIDYVELDKDGNRIDANKRDGFVFEAGKNSSVYQFDDDIVGMKANEEKIITKKYPADHDVAELAGKEVRLKVTVTAIKEKIIPALDDELAQDISDKYKTLEDLKNDIKEKLKSAEEERLKEVLATRIVETVVAASTIPIPETMVKAELEHSWDELCERFNKREDLVLRALQNDGKTKEDLFKDWRPNAEKKIKAELVINKIEESEKIEATEEDVNAEIQKYATERSLEFAKAKEAYEKMNLLDYLKRSIVREKTLAFLIAHADVKKGKKVKFLDLLQGNY
jgi:trigger factor